MFFFFQAEDGIRDYKVTGVQTCALPIWTVRSILGSTFIKQPSWSRSWIGPASWSWNPSSRPKRRPFFSFSRALDAVKGTSGFVTQGESPYVVAIVLCFVAVDVCGTTRAPTERFTFGRKLRPRSQPRLFPARRTLSDHSRRSEGRNFSPAPRALHQPGSARRLPAWPLLLVDAQCPGNSPLFRKGHPASARLCRGVERPVGHICTRRNDRRLAAPRSHG